MTNAAEHVSMHSFQCRVYSEDTDFMGIVYHANYLRYFERARTEFLSVIGFSLTDMEKYDTYFAIYESHLRYIRPARLGDDLLIQSECTPEKACSLVFNQRLYHAMNQLVCEAVVQVVCVNQELKPKRLPASLTGFLMGDE